MTSTKNRNHFYSHSDLSLRINANIEGKEQNIEIPQYALRFVFYFSKPQK